MKVLIIGNSAAALAAVESFRKIDEESSITIVSKEGGNAYSRVLLPYVLRGKLQYDHLTIRDDDYYEKYNIQYIEDEVLSIIDKKKTVKCKSGMELTYDKLLIASGSNPVKPPIPGIDAEGIYHMWTKKDVDHLTPHYVEGKRVAVIGSGFVSLQAAWAAVVRGLQVTVVELADRIMPNVLDDKGAGLLTEKIKSKGVDLRVNTLTEKIEKRDDGSFTVHFKGQESIEVDFIIVGTGVRPNTGFLEGTEVETDRGILVQPTMETNVTGVYAAGDVAQGATTFDEGPQIHALWPTAIEMGKIAGKNMAGKKVDYQGSLNMNVTQMYDVTVASIGRFSDNAEYTSVELPQDGGGYLKICSQDHKVIGACLVGSSEAVKVLGKLRPLIRKRTIIDVEAHKLEMLLQIKAYASKGVL